MSATITFTCDGCGATHVDPDPHRRSYLPIPQNWHTQAAEEVPGSYGSTPGRIFDFCAECAEGPERVAQAKKALADLRALRADANHSNGHTATTNEFYDPDCASCIEQDQWHAEAAERGDPCPFDCGHPLKDHTREAGATFCPGTARIEEPA